MSDKCKPAWLEAELAKLCTPSKSGGFYTKGMSEAELEALEAACEALLASQGEHSNG